MAEKAPLLMLSLALRRQRRQREQDAEEQRQLEMKNAQQQQQMQQQQHQSIARSPRPSIRRLSSSPLLPVIHEASSDDSDSHYSINTPSRGGDALASPGHCNNPSSGSSSSSSTPSFNSMSRHINWPPEDATWPPNNDNNGEHQGIIESTISYGSFHHHPSHHNEQQQQDFEVHPDYISSSPSDSSGESNDGQSHYSITRRKRKNPNHLLRSRKHKYTTILVAAFAVCLPAVVWYPLLREPESHLPSIRSASIDDDDDDGQVPYTDRPSYPPWGYFKLRGKNKNSPEKALVDDEDTDDDVAPSWYRHRHSILNGNYSMDSEIVVDDSAKQSNITTPTMIGGGDNTTPSFTISSDILFADLAAMLLPPYFQQTVNLCMSTLIESNQTNNTNFNPRTSVMPNEVYILRKTILKTRDLFDVFSPVYSKHSSLDDYDATQEEHDVSSKTRRHVSWGNGVTSFELTLQSDTMEHDTSKKKNKKATRKKKKRNKKETKEKKREKIHEKEQEVKEETTSFHDLWSILRRYLDRGYVLIGAFQDLDHAKIKYTSEQLAEYQHLIWKWNEDFLSFVKVYRHHISLYLSLPCKKPQLHHTSSRYVQCRHVHTHSSHLFWGNVTSKEELPDGNLDTATMVLGKLGSAQLGRAEMYLRKALTYDRVLSIPTVNETSTSTSSSSSDSTDEEDGDGNVHEIYHNLRKELRSFVDELDLFGNLLLPNSTLIPEIVRNNSTASDGSSSLSYIEQRPPQQEQTDQALYAVKRTRKTLGDLNDDYVKYMKYLEWDEYPQERQRIQTIIEAQWGYFRVWAREVDLFALIQHLRNIMEPQDSGDVMKNHLGPGPDTLEVFLMERKANPTNHFVLGNDAGDADSIISAITLAYIESKYNNREDTTPVVSISKEAFTRERPEVNLLFHLAGIQDPSDKLLFINDLKVILEDGLDSKEGLPRLSLVDHNTLNKSLRHVRDRLTVVEIVDHHMDEEQYEKTCNGKNRNIAFSEGQALVASTTTLVAERLRGYHALPYPSSIGILLLGTILLDSVNLDESVGKVTERDSNAVHDLISHTDWGTATPSSCINRANGTISIDTNDLFNQLQLEKYNPSFWDEFTVDRALRYDFKYFEYNKKQGGKTKFGISSILMPGLDFMNKESFLNSTLSFMKAKKISFLGIMFAFYDDEHEFHRQLAFISMINRDQVVAQHDLVEKLLGSTAYKSADLQLEEVYIPTELNQSAGLEVSLFDQNNLTPSRKQIGPMLEEYFIEIN